GMRQLNGVYTQRFNRSHGRVGHVFQGRYKSILVQAETYLLELARYVVLNPVRAQMVKTAGQWPWSSYRYMIGKETSASWLQTDYLLQQFSSSRTQAQQSYIRFIAEGKNQPSVWTHLRQQIYLGDENFVSRMQQRIDTASDLLEVPLAQKREVARPLCDYMEEFGDKHRAIQVAYGTGRYTLKEIADYIGCHYSTVSRIVNPKSQE
ncbi:MAG: addiction module toxin RelE, partial [Gammaproteobacteria bacterium]|nr:addiction module toxin RelE [Gammaproteobacteria bacterium]